MLILDTFILILIAALLFDGIKLFIESRGRRHTQTIVNSSDKDVTILFSAYNEDKVKSTIDSMINHCSEFFIINDASEDDTLSILLSLGDIKHKTSTEHGTLYTIEYRTKIIRILDSPENRGKVPSLNIGIDYVDTKYTFMCDGDIYLSSNFDMPCRYLEDGDDAVAFYVMPKFSDEVKTWQHKILYNLQTHEYNKSMQIGRKYADKSKSVECISGAAGLFKTQRLKEFKHLHSGIWQGDDLERTLIELLNGSTIRFSDQLVLTDVPLTFKELTKQRILVWWGGLYRNIGKFIKLLSRTTSPLRLRFEMFYIIVSMLLDPLKLIALISLITSGNWFILAWLFFIYIIFEAFVYKSFDIDKDVDINANKYIILIWPIYSMLQLCYRLLGGLYITQMLARIRYREWREK